MFLDLRMPGLPRRFLALALLVSSTPPPAIGQSQQGKGSGVQESRQTPPASPPVVASTPIDRQPEPPNLKHRHRTNRTPPNPAAQSADWRTSLVQQSPGFILGLIVSILLLVLGQISKNRQARRDRALDLKRDALLEAAVAAARMQSFLANIGNVEIPREHLRLDQGEQIGWINRLHSIAGLETISRFIDLSECWADQLLRLSRKRLDTVPVIREQELLFKRIGDLHESRSKFLAQFGSGPGGKGFAPEDAEARSQFDRTLKMLTEDLEEVTRDHHRVSDLRFDLQRDLVRLTHDAVADFNLKLAETNLAARRELGMKIDEVQYKKKMRDSQERLRMKMESALQAVAPPPPLSLESETGELGDDRSLEPSDSQT